MSEFSRAYATWSMETANPDIYLRAKGRQELMGVVRELLELHPTKSLTQVLIDSEVVFHELGTPQEEADFLKGYLSYIRNK